MNNEPVAWMIKTLDGRSLMLYGEEHMNTKTFEAIEKLKEVELELHRLKNALEMANTALDPQRTWVGLAVLITEAKLRSKNNG